jgi:hypothetical protein
MSLGVFWYLHIFSTMCGILEVGILVYIFAMSNDASQKFWLYPSMFCNSDSKCCEFFMLKVYGNCNSCCSFSDSNFASLYAGACCQFMIGRIGDPSLWIFIKPLRFGALGLIHVYFHFMLSGRSMGMKYELDSTCAFMTKSSDPTVDGQSLCSLQCVLV